MSQAKQGADLQGENKRLKEELQRLKQLAGSIESKDEVKKVDQSVVETEAIKAAFDKFDLDKSGFIDSSELAKLAVALGKPLAKDDLEKALKEIDTSGDQKISFPEFRRWWKGENKSGFQALRDALRAGSLLEAVPEFLNKLSQREPGNHIRYNVDVSTGDFQPAASDMTVDFSLSFISADEAAARIKDTGIQDALSAVFFKFLIKDDTSDGDVKAFLDLINGTKDARAKVAIENGKKYAMHTKGVPEDPTAQMAKAGIKLNQFLKSAHARLRVGYNIDKLFDGDAVSADLARGRFTLQFDATKSFFETVAALSKVPGFFAFNLMNKLDVEIQTGDLKALALAAKELNEYLEQVLQQQIALQQQQQQQLQFQGFPAAAGGGGGGLGEGPPFPEGPNALPPNIVIDHSFENRALAKNPVPKQFKKGASLKPKKEDMLKFFNFWRKNSPGVTSFEVVMASGLVVTIKFDNFDITKYITFA